MSPARLRVFVSAVALSGCGGAAMPLSGSDPSLGSDAGDSFPCGALKPLADLPMLGPWQTRYPYYSPDGSWLLLHVLGNPDRLLRVELPSGNITTVVDALLAVTPLGDGGPYLLHGTHYETSVYDGKEVRKLWAGQCRSEPSADGTRVYVIGECVGDENGLVAIDVATGSAAAVDQRAASATTWDIAVSPTGQWVAYTTGDDDVDTRTIAVANAAGDAYTVASVRGVVMLQFVSEDLIVFHTGGKVSSHGDIRGHVPGSGDTSFVIAADLDPGPEYYYLGYQLSPDRTRVLAARRLGSDTNAKTQLYSVPLLGGEPLLLVEDWQAPSYETALFYFDSQGKYVIYASEEAGGITSWVVDAQGSPPRKVADGWALPTPATSSALSSEAASDGRRRLRLIDLATLRDRLSYVSSDGVVDAATLRGDQAVSFGEYLFGESDMTVQARFMSVRHPRPVLLGTWKEDRCRGCMPLAIQPDPTGCFTVIKTDGPPEPGTRIVLLPE